MKEKLGTILASLAIVLLIAGYVVLCSFASRDRESLICSDMEVIFNDSLKFVSVRDVKQAIERHYGRYVGERTDSVGLDRIERILKKNAYITDCQAWMTDDGILHITIDQRLPLFRFNPDEGEGFYLDGNGFVFPLHPDFSVKVPEISGVKPHRNGWIPGGIELVGRINALPEWKCNISGIRLDGNGEFTLRRADRREVFILGQPENLEDKFRRLNRYFKSIDPLGKEYTSVNVKFNSQIICRNDI